ncbi:DUF930 domain-containing protein [Devosia sp.]|uniref:DUF930 domain-containing protein n=1 Tax=Devosia sp. TaxID=1871048 RepID=UPI00326415B3
MDQDQLGHYADRTREAGTSSLAFFGEAILIFRPRLLGTARGDAPVWSTVRALPASLLLHGLTLAAMWAMFATRQLEAPTVPSIAIDIISEADYLRATRPVDTVPQAVPAVEPQPEARPQPLEPKPEPASEVPEPNTIQATQFLANDILKDPKNQQVRDTLTLLDRSERITQLCNIEGLEQLRLFHPGERPDSLDPSALAETTVREYTLEAPGGAYRLNRKWYEIRLTCTVAPDYLSVSAFSFAPGPAIPKERWESHNLIDDDVELD